MTCDEIQVLLPEYLVPERRLLTIVFMTRAPAMQAAAIGHLLLCNVMFLVPRLAIVAMTYFGVRSETLGNMLRKRLALAKFGMAGLFSGLQYW